VIFDLDGTLIDSVSLIVEIVTQSFVAASEPVPDEKTIRSVSGLSLRDAIAVLAPALDATRIDFLVSIYRQQRLAMGGVMRERMFPGALEALDRLQADPDTILAVATGKGYRGAVTLLESHGIIGRFHSIQTPDHNRGKPDPQMIETAMTRAGATRGETVMIGDTIHDMRMAKSAGVAAIGVGWGYHEQAELRSEGADVVIDSFDRLDAAIDQLLGAVDA
jgi:phosphoglycolate phosphatase